MTRQIFALLLFGLWLSASAAGEEQIYFRGKALTQRHFVYGKFDSTSGNSGTINLGYAHGVQVGQELAVLRPAAGNLIPLGVLRLDEVRAGEAYGRFEADHRLASEDLVLVAARELNLWRGRSRIEQVALDTLYLRAAQRGYDTGALTPALMKELGRDDDLLEGRKTKRNINAVDQLPDRPFVTVDRIVRGAFRPANSLEGVELFLSPKDRELAKDEPTLKLQLALAKFVFSNAAGQLEIDEDSLQRLADELPGNATPRDASQVINDHNKRIRHLIQPN